MRGCGLNSTASRQTPAVGSRQHSNGKSAFIKPAISCLTGRSLPSPAPTSPLGSAWLSKAESSTAVVASKLSVRSATIQPRSSYNLHIASNLFMDSTTKSTAPSHQNCQHMANSFKLSVTSILSFVSGQRQENCHISEGQLLGPSTHICSKLRFVLCSIMGKPDKVYRRVSCRYYECAQHQIQ
jgi:hypothetical protein